MGYAYKNLCKLSPQLQLSIPTGKSGQIQEAVKMEELFQELSNCSSHMELTLQVL